MFDYEIIFYINDLCYYFNCLYNGDRKIRTVHIGTIHIKQILQKYNYHYYNKGL